MPHGQFRGLNTLYKRYIVVEFKKDDHLHESHCEWP